MAIKVGMVSLGCPKNQMDAELMLAKIEQAGFELTADSGYADVVIVNTCGFIADAKQESIENILEFAQLKKEKQIKKIIVTGCLAQRYQQELAEEIPECDAVLGLGANGDIAAVVEQVMAGETIRSFPSRDSWCLDGSRVLTTPHFFAYLRIADGCDNRCTYCAIPLIRGKHESVPMEQVLEEARKLAERGVKEIMVIAQDTTYYGIDLYGRRRLADLLTELCRIEGIEWIRLHYAYPAAFPEDVIEVMAREPKICKYLDIPFQHISDNMLSAMKRRHTKAEAVELVNKLRKAIPDIALRTTLLVGYPGESDADFAELMEFVKTTKFDRLGVFPYSEEEGTYSATRLKDDVSEDVKQERVDRIMRLQERVSLENNAKRIGQTMRVIIDRKEGDFYIGRSEYDSPEVDQEIIIDSLGKRLYRGRFYDVVITDCEDYDLFASLA